MLLRRFLQEKAILMTSVGIIICLLSWKSSMIAQFEQITPEQIYDVLKRADPTIVVWKLTEQGTYSHFYEQDPEIIEGLRRAIKNGEFIGFKRNRNEKPPEWIIFNLSLGEKMSISIDMRYFREENELEIPSAFYRGSKLVSVFTNKEVELAVKSAGAILLRPTADFAKILDHIETQ